MALVEICRVSRVPFLQITNLSLHLLAAPLEVNLTEVVATSWYAICGRKAFRRDFGLQIGR